MYKADSIVDKQYLIERLNRECKNQIGKIIKNLIREVVSLVGRQFKKRGRDYSSFKDAQYI